MYRWFAWRRLKMQVKNIDNPMWIYLRNANLNYFLINSESIPSRFSRTCSVCYDVSLPICYNKTKLTELKHYFLILEWNNLGQTSNIGVERLRKTICCFYLPSASTPFLIFRQLKYEFLCGAARRMMYWAHNCYF